MGGRILRTYKSVVNQAVLPMLWHPRPVSDSLPLPRDLTLADAALKAARADVVEALPRLGTFDEILREQAPAAQLVRNHMIDGDALAAEDFEDGQELETVAGQALTVAVSGDAVRLRGKAAGARAKVVAEDIKAGDAFIHIIDGVLIP